MSYIVVNITYIPNNLTWKRVEDKLDLSKLVPRWQNKMLIVELTIDETITELKKFYNKLYNDGSIFMDSFEKDRITDQFIALLQTLDLPVMKFRYVSEPVSDDKISVINLNQSNKLKQDKLYLKFIGIMSLYFKDHNKQDVCNFLKIEELAIKLKK